MSRSKIFLALLFFLGGGAAFWFGRREAGRESDPSVRAMRELGAIQMAIERYTIDTGGYPARREGLGALFHRPYTVPSRLWLGPYMDGKNPGDLRDPWGRPYIYEVGSNGHGTAVSLGADGQPGGSGPDQDISGDPTGSSRFKAPPVR